MSNFYLLAHNYMRDTDTISGSVSSVAVSGSGSTLFAEHGRARPWRSGGRYVIESGSNSIVFQETDGVDLTATVTAGTYATRALFFTAISTALDAAGASTYSVSADASTGKIVITSNGAGGGGIFKIMWTSSTDMADVIGFDSGTDSTGALTYTADVLRIHTSEAVTIDFGVATNPEAFVILGPRSESIKLSNTAVIKLQGNETDVWTSPTYTQTFNYHDSAIVAYDPDGLHTDPLRYWRLYIEDVDNSQLYVEIHRMYLGSLYAPTRGGVQFPFESALLDYSQPIMLESGSVYADERQRGQTFTLRYWGLTKTELEALVDIFDDHGTFKPLMMIADPDAVYSSEDEYYTRSIRFTSGPTYRLESPNNYSFEIQVEEEL